MILPLSMSIFLLTVFSCASDQENESKSSSVSRLPSSALISKPKPTPKPTTTLKPKLIDQKKYEFENNLIAKQKEYFPKILDELKKNKAKTSHWIWWVFPTEMPGASEPLPKTRVSVDSADDVLSQADINAWSEILEEIYNLSSAKTHSEIMPSIDHGRIGYALKFWLGSVGATSKKYPRFYNALIKLNKFNWNS